MARKEQITITLSSDLTAQLREVAKRRNLSLSAMIEACLLSSDVLAEKTDIRRVLDLLDTIRAELAQSDQSKEQG